MKTKAIIILSAIIVVVIGLYLIFSGPKITDSDADPEIETSTNAVSQPLNLSIYLDLSDRIKPNGTEALSQKDKDIAIVDYLANYIKERAVAMKILPCKDRIKVFFYPEPNDAKVALLSDKLELDLGLTAMKEKKKKLISFTDEFKNSLEQIYSSTIQTSNWLGSDIWGFFNKPITNYCIKDGYHNVLVVLTDGYIYHASNKRSNGNSHTFILPQTLRDKTSSLISGESNLENLEVLMLELNPNPVTDQAKMEQVITDWLKSMKVKNCYVGETDVPSNTKMIIENFLKQQ